MSAALSVDKTHEVTKLLTAWSEGDQRAMGRLMDRVYVELRRIAQAYMGKERPEHTLQPTALVHEAFVRLSRQREVSWRNRQHFFAIAAYMMRRILVDHARGQVAARRGNGSRDLRLDEMGDLAVSMRPEELVLLDASLTRLARVDPTKSAIVHLRFFAGLSIEETAAIIRCSRATVVQQWRMAKAWLYRDLRGDLAA